MKLFSFDNLLATLVVLGVLKFLPYIFDMDYLEPIQNTFEEFNVSDVVFSQIRDNSNIEIDSNIVLVNVGYRNRPGIAELINHINQYQPKVIGLDIMFGKEKTPEENFPLAQSMSEVENLVMVCSLATKEVDEDEAFEELDQKFDTMIVSRPEFTQWGVNGYSNLINREERPKSINRFSPKEEIGDSTIYALSTQVAKLYSPHEADVLLDRDNTQEIINFRRNIDKYITFDVDDIYEKPDEFEVCRDKIVLLGFLGPDLNTHVTEDIFFTPLNDNYVGRTFPDMYGVVVHANILSMILSRDYLEKNSFNVSVILVFLIVYFNMFLFSTIRSKTETWYEPASFLIIFSELFGIFWLLMFVFHYFNFEVIIAGNFLGILFSGAAFELYQDSFKPLAISGYERIADLIRGRRK